MFTQKACTTTCVLDGRAVTLTYFPDTTLLRITDAAGRCVRETRWPAPWRTLLATLREFSGREVGHDVGRDVDHQLATIIDEMPAAAHSSSNGAPAFA